MNASEILAKNLKRYRRDKGMAQHHVGTEAGICQSYICQIEKAKHNPSLQTIERIANVLDVSVGEMLSA